MNSLIINQARLVNTHGNAPSTDAHTSTVFIHDGHIVGINNKPNHFPATAPTIDAEQQSLCFALADLSVHLTEKGGNQQGVMSEVIDAAIHGGVAHIACSPDNSPILDQPRLITQLIQQSAALNSTQVHPIGALTQGLHGEHLAEMVTLVEHGCIALSQADYAIANTLILQRALAYAASFKLPVWLSAQDASLSSGFAASGPYASRLGLSGIPVAAESIALFTLFELLRGMGSNAPKVHVCRISSARAVDMIRSAKAEGLNITCDVNMHHLHFIDQDMGWFNSQYLFNPPLRSDKDRTALIQGVLDGTIDAIVSDHTAVNPDTKNLPVGQSIPGAVGVQWLLNSAVHLAHTHSIDPAKVLSACINKPHEIMGLPSPRWEIGAPAHFVLYQAQQTTTITPEHIKGKHHNTPWLGYELMGRITQVIHHGKAIF